MSTQFWRGRRVLVTGATGLMGSWLAKRLREHDADVTAYVRGSIRRSELVVSRVLETVNIVHGDVRDLSRMKHVLVASQAETVFHLAAQTIVGIAIRDPLSTWETNVGGTWNLLEACKDSPRVKQIVLASSDKAYGDHDDLPYSETHALKGINPYDCSKACSDLIGASYAKAFGLPVAITRCGNFYGGGDVNWNRIVPGTIRSALKGEAPVIRSDGTFIRDYFYVEDAAEAYMTLAERLAEDETLKGEAFNFSNETRVNVLQLTKKILERLGRTDLTPDVRNEVTHEIRNQYLSAQKARTRLKWKPRFNLDQGLDRTIAWYKRHLEGEAWLTASSSPQ